MGTRRKHRRLLATALLAGILGSAAYAFTASNTVPATSAGNGSQAISGYVASSVNYNLNGTTPTNIDSVSFTLDAAATTVKAKLTASGSWYSCTNSSGNSWSCATTSPQATVAAADNLTVLAVN